jgi:hypothetical protein
LVRLTFGVFSSSLSFIVIARQYALRHDRSNST